MRRLLTAFLILLVVAIAVAAGLGYAFKTYNSPGPLAAASVEEAALLLALQVAQARRGAELLVEQGAAAHVLTLG